MRNYHLCRVAPPWKIFLELKSFANLGSELLTHRIERERDYGSSHLFPVLKNPIT